MLAKHFIKPNLSRHSIFTRNYRTATNQEIKRLTDGIKFLYKDEKNKISILELLGYII